MSWSKIKAGLTLHKPWTLSWLTQNIACPWLSVPETQSGVSSVNSEFEMSIYWDILNRVPIPGVTMGIDAKKSEFV